MPAYAPFTAALFATGLITALISLYALQRRSAKSATISLFMLALTIYSVGYGMELTRGDLGGMLFWIRVEYLGVSVIPALFAIMAIQFAGRKEWLTPPLLASLFIIPLVTLSFNWTNGLHHLFYARVAVNDGGPFPVLSLEKGPVYWVHIAYVNLSLLFGNVLFSIMLARASSFFRKQAAVMLVGSLFPWTVLILYLAGITPWGLDTNPFMFSISGIILSLGIYRYRIINILPIARDVVFDSIQDGIIVLDDEHAVIDLNPAAKRITGSSDLAIGMPAGSVCSQWDRVLGDGKGNAGVVLSMEDGRYIDARLYRIRERDRIDIGHILSLHDITEEKMLAMALSRREKRMRDDIFKVRTIQSIMAPEIRDLPGYDIAASFIPAEDLSGDFIDGYYVGDDIFQIILCDVMEHGMASSYIGMAIKSIFKAVSGEGMSPADILGTTNMKLVDQLKATSYFASAAVCQVNLAAGEVLYSSGGHPPSLWYRAGEGRTERMGFTGPLLGITTDAAYRNIAFSMGVGDALLLYTDGAYEVTRRETREIYGMDALAVDFSYNARYPSLDIIHSIIDRIFTFIDYSNLDDDITMLCVKKTGGG